MMVQKAVSASKYRVVVPVDIILRKKRYSRAWNINQRNRKIDRSWSPVIRFVRNTNAASSSLHKIVKHWKLVLPERFGQLDDWTFASRIECTFQRETEFYALRELIFSLPSSPFPLCPPLFREIVRARSLFGSKTHANFKADIISPHFFPKNGIAGNLSVLQKLW